MGYNGVEVFNEKGANPNTRSKQWEEGISYHYLVAFRTDHTTVRNGPGIFPELSYSGFCASGRHCDPHRSGKDIPLVL